MLTPVRAAAVIAVLTLVAVGCSSDPSVETADPTESTVPTTSTTVATTTTDTSNVGDAALPTPTNPPKPDVCEPDMGTTLQGQYWFPPYPDHPVAPEGWEPPARDQFDWNQDGQPDTLTVADGTVRVDWGTGSITVTDVNTDYWATPAVDDDGLETLFANDQEQLAADHVPAAVGDVTGDGLPDLIVSHGGHTRVLIGQGSDTPPGTLAFDEVGVQTLGWHSPPVRPLDSDGEPNLETRLLPAPTAHVEVVWDTNGDGANDFRVSRLLDRAGPLRIYFDGVPCELP